MQRDAGEDCLDDETVLGFIQGQLAPEASDAVHRHIDRCGDCRTVLAETTKAYFHGDGRAPEASFGRYLVRAVVGAGASGVVYATYDPTLDRKVALKLLRPDSAAGGRERLLKEARAMARLTHPNVVAVHETGTFGDQVFLAMDYAEGGTLAAWQRAPRTWRATVQAYLQAGRGLAAAHLAGLVHGDFKPDNALVGGDGVVRVTDFGLSRPLSETAEGAAAEGALDAARSGIVAGTPRYMAPEQLGGHAVDGRADQFAFCVALYEALYREPPFSAPTLEVLRAQVAAGEVSAPRDRSVPAWLRRVLLRGMRAEPAARYPTMEALLADLARDPGRAWRRAGLALAALALLALPLGLELRARHAEQRLCGGGPARLAGVWDEGVAAEVQAALAATGRPFAASAAREVTRQLDGYAGRWTAMYADACEATHLRGEQSSQMLDLRMRCLDQRRGELAALTRVLRDADGEVAERAVQAAGALTPIARCADGKALAEAVPFPTEPRARAAVERVNDELSALKALRDAGKLVPALERARRAEGAARATGFAPTEAQALLLLGDLQSRGVEPVAAEATLRRAASAADRAHDDRLRALAWVTLAFGAARRNNPVAFDQYDQIAGAALDRVGPDDDLEAERLNAQAAMAYTQGRYGEALPIYRRRLALVERLHGPRSVEAAKAHDSIGITLIGQVDFDGALAELGQARSIFEQLFGRIHPGVASAIQEIGIVQRDRRRLPEAAAAYKEAIAIGEQVLGPKHPDLAAYYSALADVAVLQHDWAGATAAARRALVIDEAILPPGHLDLVFPLANLGEAELGAGELDAARGHLERALAIRKSGTFPPEQLAEIQFALARTLQQSKRDPATMRTLALAARQGYAHSQESNRTEIAEIDRWLVAHGGR